MDRYQEMGLGSHRQGSQPSRRQMGLDPMAIGMTALRYQESASPEERPQIEIRTRVSGIPHRPGSVLYPYGHGVLGVGGPVRPDAQVPTGIHPTISGCEFVHRQREPRSENVGSVGSSQRIEVFDEACRPDEGEGVFPGPGEAVLEGEEKGGKLTHVIGVEVRYAEVGNPLPAEAQAGQGPKGTGTAIQKDGRRTRLHPVGRGSSRWVRNESPRSNYPNSHCARRS